MGLLLSRLELILEVLGKSKIIVGLLEGIPTMLKGEVAMTIVQIQINSIMCAVRVSQKGLFFKFRAYFCKVEFQLMQEEVFKN
ncbi:uncharacterized protein LOC131019897 isoform X7 [Salvia miltiorrhiza]|uniref:uncharacterized protein LOC131019897 isoform X7 n=1 Tax=Salvia miltiorrhiza TaxID=226208 RepID=UPI0025AD68F2|nr:uncharacterized protein LOC131019897 isoform X7 [Salvia miltiorrhiza]